MADAPSEQNQRVLRSESVAIRLPDNNSQSPTSMPAQQEFADLQQLAQRLQLEEFYLNAGERLSRSGSWSFTPDGVCDYWSKQRFDLTGFDPAKGIPTIAQWLTRVHAEDRGFVSKTIDRMVATGQGEDVKYRLVHPQRGIRYLHSWCEAKYEGNVLTRFVCTTLDETELREMAEKLRLEEFYLNAGERLSHSGSWSFTPDGVCDYWSKQRFDLTGFDPAKGIPTIAQWLTRVHPDDREFVSKTIDRMVATGQGDDVKYRLVHPERGIRYLHSWCEAMYEGQVLTRFVCTTLDESEQHQSKAAIEKALNEIKTLKDQLFRENIALKEEIDCASMFEEIVGSAAVLKQVLLNINKVAATDSTVLITGETGTGKELVARAIHKRSARAHRAFVSINCSSIAPSLISSELFGHEKGAFTGATHRRLGRFELAEGGTIFLDEVGELPPETQVALLRVLQEREFERVGGTETISANVRILAATNRDLKSAIDSGAFRRDLFYRLNVFPIHMPPLRERAEDIRLLVQYFVERYGSNIGKKVRSINPRSMELLRSYQWPGNVRELQNIIERAVILSDGESLSIDENWLQCEPAAPVDGPDSLTTIVVEHERERIEKALAECHGRIAGAGGAAAKLGIPRQTLDSKLKSLGIDKYRFKTR
jgi:formate hydrogenlyase transcriptional activator